MRGQSDLDLNKLIIRLRDKARRKIPEAEVEDLVQEVLLVLVEKVQTERIDALQPYAEGILRHLIYDFYQKRREHFSQLDGYDIETNEASPEQRVVWMRHLRLINNLAKENSVDEALVSKHFSKGVSLREVASHLNVSQGAVNGRLFRFRQKVLQEVGNCFAVVVALVIGLWGKLSHAASRLGYTSSLVGITGILSLSLFFFSHLSSESSNSKNDRSNDSLLSKRTSRSVLNKEKHPLKRVISYHDKHQKTLFFSKKAPQKDRFHLSYPKKIVFHANQRHQNVLAQRSILSFGKHRYQVVLHFGKTKHSSFLPQFTVKRLDSITSKHSKYVPLSNHNAHFVSQRVNVQKVHHSLGSSKTQHSNSLNRTTSKTKQANRLSDTKGVPSHAHRTLDHRTVATNRSFGLKLDESVLQRSLGGSIVGKSDKHGSDKIEGHSFCVVQDGQLYSCGGNKMDDISGEANSHFSCGSDKLCQQLIGKGPSLVFTRGGILIVLGERRYRLSKDGGEHWNEPKTVPDPAFILKRAVLILNQDGSLWRSEPSGWRELRKQHSDVYEVRVHVEKGHIRVEDGAGFKWDTTWKDSVSLMTERKNGTSIKTSKGVNLTPKTQNDENNIPIPPKNGPTKSNKDSISANPLR